MQIKSSCPSGRHNSIPLIGPQSKRVSNSTFLHYTQQGRGHTPLSHPPLPMVYQPHGLPAIKKKFPPQKKIQLQLVFRQRFHCTLFTYISTILGHNHINIKSEYSHRYNLIHHSQTEGIKTRSTQARSTQLMYVCMYVCMYVRMICTYVCIVCMYVFMYVGM